MIRNYKIPAIDIWMLSCMTFVFVSLLELAAIGYLTRHLLEYRQPGQIYPSTSTEAPICKSTSTGHSMTNGINRAGSMKNPPKIAKKVEYGPLKDCMKMCLCLSRRREYMRMSPAETNQRRERIAYNLDKLCACVFPALFSVFNIWYWCTFATE